MNAPRWLQDEADIVALLHAALDRFDAQSSEARQRPTLLAVEKHLPALARSDAAADQTWRFVNELSQLGALAIRLGRRGAYDAEWQGAKLAFDAQSEILLRTWLNRAASLPPMTEWRAAVQAQATRFPSGIAALLERRIAIVGKTNDEAVRALATLGAITAPATLRQLSAHAFWGDSKVLDERGELIAALFPHLAIRERPIVVAVCLPEMIRGVLFIENQDTYTAAIAGEPKEARELALVYLSGFKSTAQRIREADGARLHFSGALKQADAFSDWWVNRASATLPVFFWGDLDFAGMQMLKSLRQRFGDVRAWQVGYAPMLTAIERQGGKQLAADSLQADPECTGCAYADQELLPMIRRAGFWDQERLSGVRPATSQTNP